MVCSGSHVDATRAKMQTDIRFGTTNPIGTSCHTPSLFCPHQIHVRDTEENVYSPPSDISCISRDTHYKKRYQTYQVLKYTHTKTLHSYWIFISIGTNFHPWFLLPRYLGPRDSRIHEWQQPGDRRIHPSHFKIKHNRKREKMPHHKRALDFYAHI